MEEPRQVFVTGGTGYLGRALLPELVARGHAVRALVRRGSEGKLPPGCVEVTGNALDATTFAAQIAPADTLVHLVGVPHPAPWKGRLFREIDLVSIQASVGAAREAEVRHLVYLSVAQPAPSMRAYVAVRVAGERSIRDAGLNATFVRPWYVLGPGHRWPYALIPLYKLWERIPATRETALRIGLVTLREMVAALVDGVENPPHGVRILDVPAIRACGRATAEVDRGVIGFA
jgi:uncharacterized protein YbjT (DUF2867 family)